MYIAMDERFWNIQDFIFLCFLVISNNWYVQSLKIENIQLLRQEDSYLNDSTGCFLIVASLSLGSKSSLCNSDR